MEVKAENNNVKISTRKVRLVADAIRGLSIKDAFRILATARKKASKVLEKTIKSAVANAINNAKLKEEGLKIKSIEVTEGVALKRFRPSTRGRVHPFKKRTSHIRVILEEAYGTKS